MDYDNSTLKSYFCHLIFSLYNFTKNKYLTIPRKLNINNNKDNNLFLQYLT